MGKGKKNQWRKCVPGIEEEIIKAKELKEIEEVSFSLDAKPRATELKYSTVPRTIVQRHRTVVNREVTDVWADKTHPFDGLSKRRREALETLSRRRPSAELPHPGTSYNPSPAAHMELLQLLADDEAAKIRLKMRFEWKSSAATADETEKPEAMEDEPDCLEEAPARSAARPKRLTTKQRRQRLTNEKATLHRQKERSKAKSDAHALRNLPKLRHEIRAETTQQRNSRDRKKRSESERNARKEASEKLAAVPFQLPGEVCARLVRLQTEGSVVDDLMARVNVHRLPAGKTGRKRQHKKLTKSVKKHGLV